MKHPTNKKERRDIHKQKLERRYNHGFKKSFTYSKFLIKRNNCNVDVPSGVYYRTYIDGRTFEKHCVEYQNNTCEECCSKCLWKKNDNRFVTYIRPVNTKNYTIVERTTRSTARKDCKKETSSRVRNDKTTLYQGNSYRKTFDMWWELY